jgi:hypothetical protein
VHVHFCERWAGGTKPARLRKHEKRKYGAALVRVSISPHTLLFYQYFLFDA